MKSLNLRLLLAGFIALASVPAQAQTIWEDTAEDGSWSDTTNWSNGIVPGVSGTPQDVQIGTMLGGDNTIILDTGSAPTPVPGVIIASLEFNNTLNTGIDIGFPGGSTTLTVNGQIQNNSSFLQDITVPVIAGGNATYAGGADGLTFDWSLDVGTFNIATSGTVNVSGNLSITINSTAAGLSHTTFGTIGPINATGAAIQITGTYANEATLAADAGDFFQLTSGNFSGQSSLSLPGLHDTGLTWVQSLINKGILFVEPSSTAATNPGATLINSGVVLPIGNDTEFNGTGTNIILNKGELLTSNNGPLDTGGSGTTPFSTSRNVTLDTVTTAATVVGTLAAATSTVATYNGIIADQTGGTGVAGTLVIGDGTNDGTVLFNGANTYAGITKITAGSTLQLGNGTTTGGLDTASITDNGAFVVDYSVNKTDKGTVISGTGSVTQLGTGTLSITAADTYSGGTTITNGILNIGNAGTTGSIVDAVTDNAILAFDRTNAITFAGAISGSGSVEQIGTSTLTLSGTNGYMGGTLISGGVLQATSAGTNLGTGTISLDGGELLTTGASTTSAGLATNTSTDKLAAANSTTAIYNGIVANGGTTGQLTIGDGTNDGTVDFTDANTYTGGTTVGSGTFEVDNTTGSATGTGAVTVHSGATLLGAGTSAITGPVTINGGGNLSLRDGAIGTLTVGGLSTGQAGTPSSLSFDIKTAAGTTTVDEIVDNGSLTFTGANGTTITIGNLSGTTTLTAGTYNLISYTGTPLANLTDVTLSTTTLDSMDLSLVNTPNLLQLDVTTPVVTISTTYNLTTTAGAARIMSGKSTTLSTTITNTGTGTSDTLNYTGLGASATGVAGATTSGGPLANGGGVGTNSGQTFSSTTAGAHVINPTVATAKNATIGGNATLNTSTGTTVDVLNNRTENATSVALGRVLVGQTTGSQTTTISSVTGQDASLTRTTLGAGSQAATGVTNGTITVGAGTAYQFGGANDATNSTTRGVTGTFTAAGSQSGTALITPTGEGLTGEVVNNIGIAYTADAVAMRSITNGATTNLGNVHDGATINATSNAFTSAASNTVATSVTVAAAPTSGSPDANGITLTGTSTLLNGTTTSGTRTLGGTITGSGTTAGSFNLGVVTAENGGAGLAGEGAYNPVAVAYTANVYSGQGVWNTNGSGSWGTLVGTGANAFGTNWGAGQGSPGLDANFTTTDTATFDNTALTAGSSATVSLNGASPSLNAISFNTTGGGGYTIAQGSGGTLFLNGGGGSAAITDTSGAQTISAPVSLTTNANVDVAASQQLTISGAVSGAGGLTMTGAGTTILSGTDSYTGATNINAGTVAINGTTLATGTVGVADGATLAGTGTTGVVTVAGGGAINLQNGSIGTLTVKGLSIGNAATPSSLSFDIGAGATNNLDKIVDNGTLTLGGVGGTTINIGNVSGTPTLTNGTYTLISSTGLTGSLSDLTLSTLSLDSKSLSLSIVGNSIDLTVANLTNAYTLGAVATDPRIMVNTGSTTVTATITNTGAPGTVTFTGLNVNTNGGTLSGGTLPISGGPLAAGGGSDSGTTTLSAGATTGAVTVTPVVGTVMGSQGTPTLAATTPATIDIVDNRVVTASTVALGRVLVGQAVSGISTLSTTGADANFTRVTVGTAGPDANGISATGGANTTFNSATSTDTRTVGGTFATAGNANGALTLTTTGEGLAGEAPINVTLDYSADAVNKRVITNGATTNLGLLHSGATVNMVSNAFTTTGTNVTTTSVTVAAGSGVHDANGVTLTGAATTFNGTLASDTRTFGGTISGSGTVNGSFNLAVTTLENSGAGLAGEGAYNPVAVAYTANVYSGLGVWNTNGSGSWGTLAGTGAGAFGLNWGAGQGSPGLDPNFVDTDTATFNNSVLTAGGSATVTLDGASPSLKSITFNTTGGGGYTIAQGTGGTILLNGGAGLATITDSAGSDTISAPILLDTNASVSVASAADTLTISGGIGQGSSGMSLTVNGAGTVVLSGANNYSGGTTLSSGTLDVTGGGTLGSTGGPLTVAGGTLDLGTTTQTTGAVNITGTSTIQNGTLTGTSYTDSAASGTVTVNAALAGAASLTKTGASTLALNGADNYSAGTTISGGTVAVGNLTALGTGNVSMSNGLLETGNGVHQINVGGTYTQTGGLLKLNLTGTTAGANPGYEFLNVGGGAGTANLGGALQVVVSNPYVPTVGDAFTFVQAGTINGGFTSVTTNLFSLSITQKGAGVIISQLPFATLPGIGYSPNELSIAKYVDASFQGGASSPSFQTLLGALNSLTTAGASPTVLPDAFSQLSSEKFFNFVQSNGIDGAVFSTEELDGFFENQHSPDGGFTPIGGPVDSSGLSVVDPSVDPSLSQVSSQLLAWSPAPLPHGMLSDTADPVIAGVDMKEMQTTPAPEPTVNNFNVFVLGSVVLAQNFSQVDTPHSDTTTGAVQIGGDYRITPHLRTGVLFGYGHTDADLDNNGSKATVDSYSPGAYVSYAEGGWYANAIGSYGFDSLTEDRHVSFGGLNDIAHGAPDGDQIVGDLDGGYDFHVKKWTFGPSAGVQYTHLDVDSFTESGAAPVDLDINKVETDSLRSRLGGHVSYLFHTGTILLTPHLDASWQHEFMNQSQGITSQFTSVGAGSFTIATPNPSRDSALIDCGLSADLNGQISLYLDYLVQAGQENYFGQSVQGGVKVGF
jgi:autotransporter-associated beta strand protein